MPNLQESKGRYHIAIPAEMVKAKGWRKGQKLLFIFNERGNVEIASEVKGATKQ